jgi:beta-lactam-binding protein with PASTA domain
LAGGEVIARDLAYAEADGVTVPAARYNVAFTGGPNVDVDVTAGSAWTVASGFPDASATAYPIVVAPIGDDDAKIAVWNATLADIEVSVNGESPATVAPGMGVGPATVAAGSTVPITIDGVETSVSAGPDSYTDVFAVNVDGATPAVALAAISSMADLIEALTPTDPGPDPVVVPDVVGQAADAAATVIAGAGLVAAATEKPSDDVEVGLVIETIPAAGTEVTAGSTVTIAVSTGPEAPATIPVPDVAGLAAADAQAALEAEGFVVTTSEQASDEIEAGLVIETNPSAGTEVAPETTVDMAVSTGPEDVEVPEFIGMTTDEATTLAEESGLTITFVNDPDRPNPNGIVVDQVPEPGEMVEPESEVTAQLSPLVDAPYVVISVDTNRMMTTTGINFEPGSTTLLSVVGTDRSEAVPVNESGTWWETFQLGADQAESATLLVEGTSATGSPFRATFEIPPAGGSTDEATESTEAEVAVEETESGFPWWGWLLIALGAVGIGVLAWWLVAGRDGATVTTTDGGDGQAPPPPAPPAPPASDG